MNAATAQAAILDGIVSRPWPGRNIARVCAILVSGAAGLVLGAMAGTAVLLACGLVAPC